MDSAHAEQFARHGWVVIPDVIDADAVLDVRDRLGHVYPSVDEVLRAPDEYPWVAEGQFGGLRLWPLDDLVLDLLPLADQLMTIAQDLIGTDEITLLRAGYQAKYAATVDFDQVLHYDYQNHSLVVPADNDIVGFFLYLSDITAELGPTMVVSDEIRGSVTPDRTHLAPAAWPDYYEREQPALGGAGSLLAYRSTTYHRGSAMEAARGLRLTLGYAYGKSYRWHGFLSFPRLGEEKGLINAVVAASPRQRELLGFPPVDDPYWTTDTVAAVAQRYPGFDPAPYG